MDESHLATLDNWDINNLMKTLLQFSPGDFVRVIDFHGGINLRSKLIQYGIHPGDCLRLLRKAPLGGPLLVLCNEREIALGRGVADKIIVETDSCESH
jgi:ferrous iron transport protein A